MCKTKDKYMKNIKTLLLTIIFSLFVFSIYPATSAQLEIMGNVPSILDIKIKSINTNLDLSKDASSLVVAELIITSNRLNGYTISVSSSNDGKFVNLEGASDTLSYTIEYNGNSYDLSNTQIIEDKSTKENATTKEIYISYSGDRMLTAGDYRDTLIFTITAK